jgi:YGGT family
LTDPYLNLFRGVIPPLFGLDFSPILAFFLLNLLSNATAAVGCEIPPGLANHNPFQSTKGVTGHRVALPKSRAEPNQLSLNL